MVKKPVRIFFLIELGTRRVHFAGCTEHPTADWVSQQGRQLTWTVADEHRPMRFLIRDRDAKFTASFDTVFAAEGVKVMRTPYRTPKANAFAERWIRSAKEECLDQLLILNEDHLRRVMMNYIEYYNRRRPHQGTEQRGPIPIECGGRTGMVRRHDVLGDIIHDYERAA
jgi:hypothetical protein